MAAQLSLGGVNLAAPKRRAAALALVAGVVLVHVLVTREVLERMDEFAAASAMPPRIEVTYVRELELAPPPAVAPVVVAPPPPRRRAAAAAPAAPPAPEAAASAPQTVAEPAPSVPTPEPVPAPVAEAPPAATTDEAAAAAPADAQAFDWPLSTRLTYGLTGNYRGELHGDAQGCISAVSSPDCFALSSSA